MEGLKVSDLIPGEFYHITFEANGGERELVFKHKDSTGTSSYPNDKDRPNTFFYVCHETTKGFDNFQPTFERNKTPWITGRKCRLATPQEKYWLQECDSQNKYVDKPGMFIPNEHLTMKSLSDQWFVNVVGLDDPADDRLIMNFTDDLELIGFSSINKGAIFKIKERGQTEAYWYENVISKISDMGGLIQMLSTNLPEHLKETLQ